MMKRLFAIADAAILVGIAVDAVGRHTRDMVPVLFTVAALVGWQAAENGGLRRRLAVPGTPDYPGGLAWAMAALTILLGAGLVDRFVTGATSAAPGAVLGVTVILGGVGLRLWAFASIGADFLRPPGTNGALMHVGPYRFARHPANAGLFLIGAGTALSWGSAYASAATLLLLAALFLIGHRESAANAKLRRQRIDAKPPRKNVKRRVLVLGGSGATGSLIVADLVQRNPTYQVDIGTRRPHRLGKIPESVGLVRIDIRREEESIPILAGYDLVIIALGPFEEFKADADRLCIEAGVDCLDINDSIVAVRDILQLHELAKERGVMVLTGMGLSPGLTTLLLVGLLAGVGTPRRMRLRLFIGGNQEAGRAAIRSMVSSLNPEVPEVRDGSFLMVPSDDHSQDGWFAFKPGDKPLRVIHYPSPELWTLPRYAGDTMALVERLDYRIHFQGVPYFLITALRRLRLLHWRVSEEALARVIYRVHEVVKRRKDAGLVAVAEGMGDGPASRAIAIGPGSYATTARFASAMATLALDGNLVRCCGVRPFEALRIADVTTLVRYLNDRGIQTFMPEAEPEPLPSVWPGEPVTHR